MLPPNPKKRKRSPSRSREAVRQPTSPVSKRLHLDSTTDILRYLDANTEVSLPRLRPRKPVETPLWRPHTVAQQALVVYLRFGSLSSDARSWHSSKEVFEKTGIKHPTQYQIIKRWRANGFRVVSNLHRRGKERMLTPNQVAYLRNPKILKEWSHLSLYERTQLLKAKFEIPKMNPSTLRNYYLREKISFRKPQFQYIYKEHNQRQLVEDQQQFCRELSALMM